MKKIVFGTLGLLISYTASAQAEQIHFSADAVMKAANAKAQEGHLYVGKIGTRFDFTENGHKISRIKISEKGIGRILFLDKKEYMEFKLPAMSHDSVGASAQPCQPSELLECKKTGDAEFEDMKVESWSILPKGAPKPIKVLWDKTRKMMISQILPNGVKIINRMVGKENYEGLKVERWETAYTAPNGKMEKGMMVYAPKLEVAVLEKQPNGLVKELKNIKIAEPNAALFAVPAGFKKVEQPTSTGSIK